MKPNRYGRLRPHVSSILTWCIEGRPWAEMVETLAKAGCLVTPPAIQNLATRRGFAVLHPYSAHFSETIRTAYLRGEISEADLPKHFPDQPGKTTQTNKQP